MTKTTELRKGNLFYSHSGSILKIEAWMLEEDEIDYQPIPLSPEILEAAGFEQTSNYHPEGPTHTLKHRNGITFEVCYLYHMVDVIENIGRIRIQKIKYLHQLQNLYFALTGSELEIKNLVEV